jgi:hypothetical protein
MSDMTEPSRAKRHLGGVLALLVYVVPVMIPIAPGLASHLLNLVAILVFAPFLPAVSFRRRDFALLLVPFYGFGYAWRFGYRLASLPYRDWPLRPDEYAAAGLGPLGKASEAAA